MSGNAKQRRVRRRRELRIRYAHFEEMVADLTESSQMAPFQRGRISDATTATEVAAYALPMGTNVMTEQQWRDLRESMRQIEERRPMRDFWWPS